MHRGYATAFAMNGAAAIHDFEIALAGQTSEDVEAALPGGRFGAAEETGREMNASHRGRRDRDASGNGRSAWDGVSMKSQPPQFAPFQPGPAGLAGGSAGYCACGHWD
jgi:hypothetical protein